MTESGIAVTGVVNQPARAPVSPELRRAAEEFESIVLAQLLQPMFAAMDTSGLGGGGFGEEIFRPMLVDEYAKGVSRAGGVGLAQSIINELSRIQTIPAPQAEETEDGAGRS